MEIKILSDTLRALFAVAPKKDVRYYLNGAHFPPEWFTGPRNDDGLPK